MAAAFVAGAGSGTAGIAFSSTSTALLAGRCSLAMQSPCKLPAAPTARLDAAALLDFDFVVDHVLGLPVQLVRHSALQVLNHAPAGGARADASSLGPYHYPLVKNKYRVPGAGAIRMWCAHSCTRWLAHRQHSCMHWKGLPDAAPEAAPTRSQAHVGLGAVGVHDRHVARLHCRGSNTPAREQQPAAMVLQMAHGLGGRTPHDARRNITPWLPQKCSPRSAAQHLMLEHAHPACRGLAPVGLQGGVDSMSRRRHLVQSS